MPKLPPYFSWSQYNCYKRDPQVYYMQYVIGAKQEPTPQMTFGSIAHKAFEFGEVTPAIITQLRAEGFTSDRERYLREWVAWLKKYPEPPQKEFTVKAHLTGVPVPLLMKCDGLFPNRVRDYKTSSSNWSQDRADEDEQMTFYALVFYLAYGKVPKLIEIPNFNTSSGRPAWIETRRFVKQFPLMKQEIKTTYSRILEGIWE